MEKPFDHPTFRTANGFCSITPDALIFTNGIADDSTNKSSPTRPIATETTAIIDRADIISVTAHEPDPPRDRGRIVVLFKRDGVTRQRTITLEEKTGDGFEEFEAALEALNEGGIRIESERLRDDADDAIMREPADFVLEHPTFRTRSGFCSITPEEIIFTRPAGVGSFTEPITRNAGNDSRLLKALVGIMMVVIGLVQFFNENALFGILFIASGALQIAYIFTRRVPEPITPVETSITSSIDRTDIVSVIPIEPDPPRTRGTIVIRYERDGETRQRTIELEQNVGDGDEELEQAVGVMRLAGIPIS